jgi:hypothetical protein
MRLGDIIDTLERMPPTAPVKFQGGSNPSAFISWRGRYEELSLAPGGADEMTAAELLAKAHAADGAEFRGYKGGDFTMSRSTPVWADDYGDCNYNAITDMYLSDSTVLIVTTCIAEYA